MKTSIRDFLEADKEFMDGNGLSDPQLKVLLERYTDIYEGLQLLGPTFKLAANEVWRRLDRLTSYQRARSE